VRLLKFFLMLGLFYQAVHKVLSNLALCCTVISTFVCG
jgi:hypothetical protein